MDTGWLGVAIPVGIIAAFLLFRRAGQISGEGARQLIRDGGLLVDVRTPGEFDASHLQGAINLPLGILGAQAGKLESKDRPLVVYCASGTRSAVARAQLKRLGFTQVFNLGGMWRGLRALPPRGR